MSTDATVQALAPLQHEHLLALLKQQRGPETQDFLRTLPSLNRRTIDADAFQKGDRIGPYELLCIIGQGGMSQVWHAKRIDGAYQRDVALKLPFAHANAAWREHFIKRLEREVELLAKLEHPNIARFYDAGMTNTALGTQPYLALELVQGVPITQYAATKRLSVHQRCLLLIQVLEAVQFAHQHLVVHRDLKPSNIIVRDTGQIALLDFGVAKMLDEETLSGDATQLTREIGQAITPAYASPEQLLGQSISTASDIYSAGILLYELLCGQRPFAGSEHNLVALMNAQHAAPAFAVTLQSSPEFDAAQFGVSSSDALVSALNGDLVAINMHALRMEPDKRYLSAAAFAEDLERYLANKPITARRDSVAYRARKFAARHTLGLTLSSVAGISGVVLLSVAYQQMRVADAESKRADAVRGFLGELLSDAEPTAANVGKAITAKDMLDAGAMRARKDYADQPALQGMLLAEIGRIYGRIGEKALSFEMLKEANVALEHGANPKSPELNKNRIHLANELHQRGDAKSAEELAHKALSACTSRDAECAKARGYAHRTLMALYNERGEPSSALEHAKSGLNELETAFGKNSSNTLSALGDVALLARNAGQILMADEMIQRAISLANTQTSRAATMDGLLQRQIAIDLDMGRYDKARQTIESLAPPKTGGFFSAVYFKLLADVYYAWGDWDAAQRAITKAFDFAVSTDDKALKALILSSGSLIYAVKSDFSRALNDADTSVASWRALGFAEDNPRLLRSRRIQAEVLLRSGQTNNATEVLQDVLRLTPSAMQIDRALVLDLLGCAARDQSNLVLARQLHEQAAQLLKVALPARHPYAARSRFYIALLDAGSNDGNTNEGLAAIDLAAKNFEGFFSRTSKIYEQIEIVRARNWRFSSAPNGQVAVF